MLDPWRIVFEEYFEPNVLPLCAGYLKEWCFTYHTRLWFLRSCAIPFVVFRKESISEGKEEKRLILWSGLCPVE